MKNFFTTSQGFILGAITLSAVSVFAWNVPVSAPPTGNASAPINVSSASQTKLGELIVGKLTSNGPIDVTNDKIINVATPTAPSDGVNKAYVDALGGGGSGSSSYGGGSGDFAWGYTDKHYFITASKYTGNLGGFSGADAKCNTDANAISGKTYHFGRINNDSSNNSFIFNAPGVGLYNDTYGWVNSIFRVIPLYNSEILVNRNYSGNGSIAVFGSITSTLPNFIAKASDASKKYMATSPYFWVSTGIDYNYDCLLWSSTTSSGRESKLDSASYYIGNLPSTYSALCSSSLPLLCVEN